MPVEGNDPNLPRAEDPSPVPEPGTDAVDLGGQSTGETRDGTLVQDNLPSWVQKATVAYTPDPGSGSADSGSPSSSGASRSGKAVHELDRELERSRAAGADDVADGYTLIRKLGTGSFGAVWEAENRLTNERVAIKFFTAGDTDWAKMLGEVGLIQAVEGCRGIVLVKEVRPGGPGHRPHYIMQLANAGSIGDWLKAAGSLPPRERVRQAVEFFTRTARAMAVVHRRGIHHCDLKPQNILLHSPEPGAPPEPLVADFGQAHLATDDTPALGTFFYMPPDQIEAAQAGTPPDTRWDVYALGAVVYEMLTGEPPRRAPELVEKIKKAPRHLPAKMAVYRDGILAAPRPDAHRKSADPVLAKIIDRCLNLRPERRPADAGALVALLDARERWRRNRPLLGLALVATLLLITLVATAGGWAAKEVQRESEHNVTEELAGSLARTAGYSVPAVERRLQKQVANVEKAAGNVPPGVVEALTRHNRTKFGPQLDPNVISEADRETCGHWLGEIYADRRKLVSGADTVASIGLVLVTDSDTSGAARGFFVARAHPDGFIEDRTKTDTPDVFSHDFSFRDYFHGTGNRQDEDGKPHAVVRTTQISDPYRSRGDDRQADGDRVIRVVRPWKVDIATPLWDKSGTRVVGLLIYGLNLERDIVSLLEPVDLGAKGSERLGISRKVKVVLIDDRSHWVWHPDCSGWLAEDRPDLRIPHSYANLARARGLDPVEALPWMRIGAPEEGRRFGYIEAGSYVDLVEDEREDADRNAAPEIACFTKFSPYALSKYPEAHGRQWVFVAQVDRKTALAPLGDLRARIVSIGAVVGVVLSLIAVGLWVGLVVVLRRLEFASHG
jgi:serine/threonine protein kinase